MAGGARERFALSDDSASGDAGDASGSAPASHPYAFDLRADDGPVDDGRGSYVRKPVANHRSRQRQRRDMQYEPSLISPQWLSMAIMKSVSQT
ncbi:MAG: hypothetical protein EOO38_22930 [Cytophagaceae bacterium]|nr:MAG: hypothetical protein EOO38_22930 [Cytophagaceae bacterium]